MTAIASERSAGAGAWALRVTHIISGLGPGGAETMLYRLLARGDRRRVDPSVVSMTTEGAHGAGIKALGIQVYTLGMRRGLPSPWHLAELTRLLRRMKPDLVQTWMYHADLLGGLATRLAGKVPVVWGIRHGDLRPGSARLTTRLTARLNARLSRVLPAAIVCNSEASRRIHQGMGYDRARLVVIPNGFDLDEFRPDAAGRTEIRQELNLPPGALLVGNAARFHPLKDHRTLVQAAARLQASVPEVHFLLIGEGVSAQNEQLLGWVRSAGVEGCTHLLGRRSDMPRLYAALDLYCLSSTGESFPQVVGEAMACGVPCVVTDVGDAAEIVGQTGKVVAPGQPEALASACARLLRLPENERRQMGEQARGRIREKYSLAGAVARFTELYEQLARSR